MSDNHNNYYFVENVEIKNKTCSVDSIDSLLNKKALDEWNELVRLENSLNVVFKIDTGSALNILPLFVFDKLKNKIKMEETKVILVAFGGCEVRPLGKANLIMDYNNESYMQEFIIVKDKGAKPIMGLRTSRLLKIINTKSYINEVSTKIDIFVKYGHLFQGLGCMPGECHIQIKKNAIPVKKAPRRIPIMLKEGFKKTLDNLEQTGIISKVHQPVEWLNNIVIIEKPNKDLRICLDPKELNEVIITEYYPIPSLEDLNYKLGGMNYFSVLDLKDGFFQIKLDKESSEVCSFGTMYGVYKFERLPFGISMAPQYFQKVNEENFGGINGVFIYIDDILIATRTEEEHDEIFKNVLERADKLNIKFNKAKIQHKVRKVNYLGHIYSNEGVALDPKRVSAINSIQNPKSVKELQRILGMLNYLRSFVPNMAELTVELRELLKKDKVFVWEATQTNVLNKIKEIIMKAPALGIFENKKSLVIQTDASKNGIGSVLMQDGRPICYASRSMSAAEQRYPQIEKELLAIVFACNKFHNYIYGREVEIKTDHQPLVNLMKKEMSASHGARIQRMRLKLIIYSFKLSYLPGKQMLIADLLSRSESDEPIMEEDLTEVVHTINVSSEKEKIFIQETNKDETLKKLKEFIISGWPTKNKIHDEGVIRYHKYRNELIIENELIFFKDRVIVPNSLRKLMLNQIHEGHLGITKTKERAKSVMFWPNINSQIENMIQSCSICEQFQCNNTKEPLIQHEVPTRPFEKIACDIAEYGNGIYLVIMDYFSKWLEIIKVESKASYHIIEKMKTIFTNYGIPNVVVADNNPFGSREFREFGESWNFEITTTSPRYPQSNGMAEKAVQIAKRMISKNTEWRDALMQYRNTPIGNVGLSPAQIMMGRMMRTKLPTKDSLLLNENYNQIRNKLVERNKITKEYYDKSTRIRNDFEIGDAVLYRNVQNNRWMRARITKKHESPRSYIVQDSMGRTYRRTSHHLRRAYGYDREGIQHNYSNMINNLINDNNTNGANLNEFNLVNNANNQNDVSPASQNMVNTGRPQRNVRLPIKYQDYEM